MTDFKRNHYLPEWYQKLFICKDASQQKQYYLDISPKKITTQNGKTYTRKPIRYLGPPSSFYQDDLYTRTFGDFESREIEKRFFGQIDSKGKAAVEYFSNYRPPCADPPPLDDFLVYLSTQRMRTPQGLKELRKLIGPSSKNDLLFKMQELKMMHCAIWSECVWAILDATESETKFIISDKPVTYYNKGCFPNSSHCIGFNDPLASLNGTHTIFALSPNKALVLTHLSWLRNPYGNPLKERPNAKLFRQTFFDLTSLQTGRLLSEDEVISINYIIKMRAFRFIAGPSKECLFPEDKIKNTRWDGFGNTYLLMPDPRSVPFISGVSMEFDTGRSQSLDEYGRQPHERDYNDKERYDLEWNAFNAFKGEYARKFGPYRKGLGFDYTNADHTLDSEEMHQSNLRMESHFKNLMSQKWKSS